MAHRHSTPQDVRLGLNYWMQQVLEQLGKAGSGLAPGPVHDLRVAIRRCRSMAEGFRSIDSDGKQRVRKASKALFSQLGELRDVQVMLEWVQRLGPTNDGTTAGFLALFHAREQGLKAAAATALHHFDARQWNSWIRTLSERVTRVPPGSPVFEYLALERWGKCCIDGRCATAARSDTTNCGSV